MSSLFKKKTFAQRMVGHVRPFRPRNECTWENALHCKWVHFAIGVLIATLLFSVAMAFAIKNKNKVLPKVNKVLAKLKLPQFKAGGGGGAKAAAPAKKPPAAAAASASKKKKK